MTGESETAKTLLQVWTEDKVVQHNLFSISYCGTSAELTVGEVDKDTTDGRLTWLDTRQTYGRFYGYFLVKVGAISFDDEELDLSGANVNEYGGVLVDSGTTLMYLPEEIVSQMKDKLRSSSSAIDKSFFEWGSCLSTEEASKLPKMDITLEAGTGSNYTMHLDYQRYLLNDGGCLYWGVSSSSLGIIGNIAQQGHTIVFDVDNHKMGFAEVNYENECADSSSEASFASSRSGSVASTPQLLSLARTQPVMVGAALAMVVSALVAAVSLRRRRGHAFMPIPEAAI